MYPGRRARTTKRRKRRQENGHLLANELGAAHCENSHARSLLIACNLIAAAAAAAAACSVAWRNCRPLARSFSLSLSLARRPRAHISRATCATLAAKACWLACRLARGAEQWPEEQSATFCPELSIHARLIWPSLSLWRFLARRLVFFSPSSFLTSRGRTSKIALVHRRQWAPGQWAQLRHRTTGSLAIEPTARAEVPSYGRSCEPLICIRELDILSAAGRRPLSPATIILRRAPLVSAPQQSIVRLDHPVQANWRQSTGGFARVPHCSLLRARGKGETQTHERPGNLYARRRRRPLCCPPVD